jgi:hypothetical protein
LEVLHVIQIIVDPPCMRTSYAHLMTSLPVFRKLGLLRHAQKGNSVILEKLLRHFRFPKSPTIPRAPLRTINLPHPSHNLPESSPDPRKPPPHATATCFPKSSKRLPKVFPKVFIKFSQIHY